MKLFFRSILLLFIIIFSVQGSPENSVPEINFSAFLKPVSETGYSIEYNISISSLDASLFMDEKIYYPCETSIIEGIIIDNRINEKDFLYSQRNIDINGDGDTEDSFPFSNSGGILKIAGKDVTPLFRKSNGSLLLTPFDSSNNENIVRITSSGGPFIIYSFNPIIGRIKAGINNKNNEEIFKQFSNSLIIIEIIPNNEFEQQDIKINNVKADRGFTNERIFSPGGENLTRYFTGINIILKNNSASGKIKIENTEGKFKIRLRYLLAISSRVIIYDEKIITP